MKDNRSDSSIALKVFDFAVVLGGGMLINPDSDTPELTLDSKLRVLAAGLIASEGRANNLILSGGKTAGPDHPSEAETMRIYLLREYPNLSGFPIRLEEDSVDSVENAKFTSEILKDNKGEPILLITSDYHMLRASRDFQGQGLNIEKLPAEEIVSEHSSENEKFIRTYLKSQGIKKRRITELALRGIMKLDPEGKLLTMLARKLRAGRGI